MPSQPLGQGCDVESVGGGVLGDPEAGAGAGAGVAVAGAGDAVAGGVVLVALPSAGAGLAGLPGSEGIVRLGFCASGITNGPFWPQARSAPAHITTINCEIFMWLKYTRATAAVCSELVSTPSSQMRYPKRRFRMRISKTLAALFAIAACGASVAAFADNPVGFYIGAGAGESQIRSDDSRYGYPGYYNDYQTAWQGLIGIRPIKLIGLEAAYIDFGQPYRHHNSFDFNVSGSDSHPTAPALFAVGYLPLPMPFIDVFAKVGAARLSTNVTDFVQQPCVAGGPCPYFVPGSRHQVIDTRFAYGAGVQSKFPFGLILRGEYTRISSPFGDPDALLVSALWQF
jgi:hypothetical protein